MHIICTIQLAQPNTISDARTNTFSNVVSLLVSDNGRSVSFSMRCLISALFAKYLTFMFYPHSCIQYNFPTKFCSLRFPYSKLPVPYDSSEIAMYIISLISLVTFLSHLPGTSKFGTKSKTFRLAVSLSHCTAKWRTIIFAFR